MYVKRARRINFRVQNKSDKNRQACLPPCVSSVTDRIILTTENKYYLSLLSCRRCRHRRLRFRRRRRSRLRLSDQRAQWSREIECRGRAERRTATKSRRTVTYRWRPWPYGARPRRCCRSLTYTNSSATGFRTTGRTPKGRCTSIYDKI